MPADPFAKLLFLFDPGSDPSSRQKLVRRLSLDFSPVEREFEMSDGQVWLTLETPVSLSEVPDIVNYMGRISALVSDPGSDSSLKIFYVTETRIVELATRENHTNSLFIGSGVFGSVMAWASPHASAFTFPDNTETAMKDAADFLAGVRSELVDSQVRGKAARLS